MFLASPAGVGWERGVGSCVLVVIRTMLRAPFSSNGQRYPHLPAFTPEPPPFPATASATWI